MIIGEPTPTTVATAQMMRIRVESNPKNLAMPPEMPKIMDSEPIVLFNFFSVSITVLIYTEKLSPQPHVLEAFGFLN